MLNKKQEPPHPNPYGSNSHLTGTKPQLRSEDRQGSGETLN